MSHKYFTSFIAYNHSFMPHYQRAEGTLFMNNSIQLGSAYEIYVNLLEIEICRCSFLKLGQSQRRSSNEMY